MFGALFNPLSRLRLFMQVILCLVMSGFDAVATAHHIAIGSATELNPAMAYFIDKDIVLFFWIKIVITAIGMMVFYVFSKQPLARRALEIFTVAYTILTCYHYLLYRLN